jgi:hypothetical protein
VLRVPLPLRAAEADFRPEAPLRRLPRVIWQSRSRYRFVRTSRSD